MQIGDMEVQPGFSRVVHESIAGDSGEQLNRNFAADALMWSKFIIPIEIEPKIKSHIGLSHRHDDSTGAFGFQGTDHSYHDGDASIFAYGAESRLDFPASAPALEGLAPELTALVGDDVFWSLAGSVNGAAKEGADLEEIGLVVEDGEADDLP